MIIAIIMTVVVVMMMIIMITIMISTMIVIFGEGRGTKFKNSSRRKRDLEHWSDIMNMFYFPSTSNCCILGASSGLDLKPCYGEDIPPFGR
jgi:hypothetical protein